MRKVSTLCFAVGMVVFVGVGIAVGVLSQNKNETG